MKQELLLIQYHDGRLRARRRAEAQRLLKISPEARQTLKKYDRLDRLLKEMAALPKLNWDALTARISAALGNPATQRRRTSRS